MPLGFLRHGRPSPHAPSAETAAARALRVRRKAAVIADGHAEIDAGLGLEDDALEAWLDRLDHDDNAPLPPPGTKAPRR